jgi:hypothetical protein
MGSKGVILFDSTRLDLGKRLAATMYCCSAADCNTNAPQSLRLPGWG